MATRHETAATLGISERTLRRYLNEFSSFFSSDCELSALDRELLTIIHTSKRTGQNARQEIRNRLTDRLRQADSLAGSLAVLTTSVQKVPSEPSGCALSAGQNTPLTRDDLANTLTPLVALLDGLRNDVRKLSAQLEQSQRPTTPAISAASKPWRPMPLPMPVQQPPPRRVSWWRALLWPELQRNEA